MLYNGRAALIAWNPGTDEIRVGLLIEDGWADWTKPYRFTGGAAYVWMRSAKDDEISSRLKADFISVVFRDGVCPRAAYREFMKIDQFRDGIPEDMPPTPNLGISNATCDHV